MAIEHADFDGIERLAFVLGADIVSTFDTPESVRLGSCALIDEVMIGEDRLIRFSGCKSGEACTIIMRGSSQVLIIRPSFQQLCAIVRMCCMSHALCSTCSTKLSARSTTPYACSSLQ
jgi:hypothetical protein